MLNSCGYEELAKADYPQQVLYMPTAKNGLFSIASIPTSEAYRFTIDQAANKVIIPLGVYRGGLSVDGDVPVKIVTNADTISKLISSSALIGTAVLPADKFALPESVTIEAGKNSALFDLTIDLNYLLANPGQPLAIGVGIDSPQFTVNPLLKTTLLSFDPSLLRPTPKFKTRVDPATPKKVAITNRSLNAVSYSWDFGDGSAAITDKTPTYTYTKAGTYTITLTTTGIMGSDYSVKTAMTLTIL